MIYEDGIEYDMNFSVADLKQINCIVRETERSRSYLCLVLLRGGLSGAAAVRVGRRLECGLGARLF